MRQEKTKTLLDLLVQEFRLWQALSRLTRQERGALFDCDPRCLTELAKHKKTLLESLTSRQQERQALTQSSTGPYPSGASGLPQVPRDLPCDGLTPEETGCLLRLAEGIQALAEQIHELVQGNFALADCSLKRLWAMQYWLDQETQISLPVLLTSTLAGRSVLGGDPKVSPPAIPITALDPAMQPAIGDLFANLLTSPACDPKRAG